MDETMEILQRICRKTNEIDDSVTILCPDFKYVVNHFSDALDLLYKDNKRLRKALEEIAETEVHFACPQIARKVLEESE